MSEKHGKRRVLSTRLLTILLSVLIILGVMPLSVFAVDEHDKTANTDIVRTLSLSYKLTRLMISQR